jgi:CheY-like chemotaxis protein
MNKQKKKLSILIAEDNPDDFFLFQMAIIEADESIHIYHVNNGAQLIEFLMKDDISKKLRSHAVPDLIITDLKMPFLDGLEVIRKVKSHKEFENIPIYLFSSNDSDANKEKAKEVGASAFYKKPHTFRELQATIKKILKQHNASA